MPPTQPKIVCRMIGRSASASIAALPFLCLLTACGASYSPDTYSSNAVQQANKVDQGVVVGVRAVAISADSTLATATGGATGGIAGSQVGTGAVSALGAVGGSVAGGLVGNIVGHSTADTDGFEYIVRKPNGDMLSVTQKDPQPLKIGQHVLIIEGAQARIVADYTVPIADPAHPAEGTASKPAPARPDTKPGDAQATPQAQAGGAGEAAPIESKPDTSKPSQPAQGSPETSTAQAAPPKPDDSGAAQKPQAGPPAPAPTPPSPTAAAPPAPAPAVPSGS
jgi:outer membrane lipoprotein SlyB